MSKRHHFIFLSFVLAILLILGAVSSAYWTNPASTFSSNGSENAVTPKEDGLTYERSKLTEKELDQLKKQIGVYQKGKDYNEIVNGHGTGLTPPTIQEYKRLEGGVSFVEDVKATQPMQNSVDLTDDQYFPPIGDQGSQGSCASWAAAYYANTYVQAEAYGWDASSGNEDYLMSPSWVYNKANGGTDSGSSLVRPYVPMVTVGTADLEKMPYDDSDHISWGDETAWRDAPQHRITNYELSSPGEIDVLKSWINEGRPVSIAVDANQYNFGGDSVLSSQEYTPGSPNHANTIVGYDDSVSDDGETGAFKVANSWGSSWGPNGDGTYYMTYDCAQSLTYNMAVSVNESMYGQDSHPKLLAKWEFSSTGPRDPEITLGVGEPSESDVKKQLGLDGGTHDFPEFMAADITEYINDWVGVGGSKEKFFLKIGSGSGSSTISSFKMEYHYNGYDVDSTGYESPESPDTPATTPATVTVTFTLDGEVSGIDVSHWQGDIDWNAVYDDGYKFAFCKATEGTSYVDDKFEQNMQDGSSAGLYMGPYHFARPSEHSAQAEADHFLSTTDSYLTDGNLRPVLDLESGDDQMSWSALSDWAESWMSQVESETGVEPIIYTSAYWAKNLEGPITDYPLWVAHWTYDPGASPDTGNWNDWTFWQYSNQGSVSGISGDVDLDLFNGAMPMLQNYVIGNGSDDGGGGDGDDANTVITSPNSGESVSGDVTLKAEATGDVEYVKFFLDGMYLGKDSTSPYVVNWDSTGVSDGDYTLTAWSYTPSYNKLASDSIGITVDNEDDGGDDDDGGTGPIYDRTAAAAYANRYWDTYNTAEYADYSSSGGDCANYVSQCLVAGGTSLWESELNNNPGNGLDPYGAVPYCDDLNLVLTEDIGAQHKRIEDSGTPLPELQAGDVIIYGTDSDEFAHAVIVVGGQGDNAMINAHTTDRYHVSWDYAFPSYFSVAHFYHMPDSIGSFTQGFEVTASTLNVRVGPGTDYNDVGDIHQGEKYVAFDSVDRDGYTWYNFWHDGRNLWCAADYTQELGQYDVTQIDVSSYLNVRTGPSTSYSVVDSVYNGQRFIKTSEHKGWYEISCSGSSDRWIYADYTGPIAPSADFTYSPSGPVEGETIQFTDQSSDSDGSVVSLDWDFGDGSTSSQQDPTHSYSTPGDYQVELTVQDNDGATNSCTKTVTVNDGGAGNDAPTAHFTYTPSSPTVLDTLQFTDQSSDSDGNITSYSWDFGDGSTDSSQNPTYSYSSAGTYTVELTVEDDDGATDSISKTITVSAGNDAPIASFTYTPASPTVSDTVQFTEQCSDTDGSITSYSWDFGDGSTSSQQDPTHSYGSAGSYTVSLEVEDDDGATTTATQTVDVTSGGGGSTMLDEDFESGISSWSTSGLWHLVSESDQYGDSNSQSHSMWYGQDSTGNYDTGSTTTGTLTSPSVDLTGVSQAELTFHHWFETESYDNGQYDWIKVTVNGNQVYYRDTTDSNVGSEDNFVEETIDISSYTGQSVNIEFTFDTVDDYDNAYRGWYVDDIMVEGGSSGGNNAPSADFSFVPTDPSAGDTVDFTDESSDSDGNIVSYSWDFGDGHTSSQQNPSHSYGSSGTYTVILEAEDDDGATDTYSKDIDVSGGSSNTLFEEDFEGSLSWSTSGLWHKVDESDQYGDSYSSSHSMWYGQDSTGDYDTGSRTTGTLTSPSIDLTGVSQAELTFHHWFKTENYDGQYDWVKVTVNGNQVYYRDTSDSNVGSEDNFVQETIDISSYTGQTVEIKFIFDTVDDYDNAYRGWYIDDVSIDEIVTSQSSGSKDLESSGVADIPSRLSTYYEGQIEFKELVPETSSVYTRPFQLSKKPLKN